MHNLMTVSQFLLQKVVKDLAKKKLKETLKPAKKSEVTWKILPLLDRILDVIYSLIKYTNYMMQEVLDNSARKKSKKETQKPAKKKRKSENWRVILSCLLQKVNLMGWVLNQAFCWMVSTVPLKHNFTCYFLWFDAESWKQLVYFDYFFKKILVWFIII